MYFVRSTLLAAAFLLYFSQTEARVANHGEVPGNARVAAGEVPEQKNFFNHLRSIFGKRESEIVCVPDDYLSYLQHLAKPKARTFCNEWIGIAPSTVEVDYTQTFTVTTVTATDISTVFNTVRTTTVSTVTKTAVSTLELQKRAESPSPTPRNVNRAALVNIMAAIVTAAISGVAVSAGVPTGSDKASIEAGLSSACSCLNVDPTSTVTMTNTAPPIITTLNAFEREIVTSKLIKVFTIYTTTTTTSILTLPLVASPLTFRLGSTSGKITASVGSALSSQTLASLSATVISSTTFHHNTWCYDFRYLRA
ncbi:hypothetical protein K432DRAFT_428625 [Lepidopterella palustris CBS 459.81]|uniref:Uncharacterized protein n=1 Tax=Lepidopterella palustris CBS 459.81 TaxID=1314670 RepID=A0A8E2E3I9_9PEZI|nr:hypothetical protein K432DRAFT_428625 [Lepidopterella palustris CBS 459.81]